MVAVKYYEDNHYSNKFYAEVGGFPVKELNALEVAFLSYLGWGVDVPPDMFASYSAQIGSHCSQCNSCGKSPTHNSRSTEAVNRADSQVQSDSAELQGSNNPHCQQHDLQPVTASNCVCTDTDIICTDTDTHLDTGACMRSPPKRQKTAGTGTGTAADRLVDASSDDSSFGDSTATAAAAAASDSCHTVPSLLSPSTSPPSPPAPPSSPSSPVPTRLQSPNYASTAQQLYSPTNKYSGNLHVEFHVLEHLDPTAPKLNYLATDKTCTDTGTQQQTVWQLSLHSPGVSYSTQPHSAAPSCSYTSLPQYTAPCDLALPCPTSDFLLNDEHTFFDTVEFINLICT